jgi:putative transposase
MSSIAQGVVCVNGRAALERECAAAAESLRGIITQRLLLWLDQAVAILLGRDLYVRRERVDRWLEQSTRCPRCGTRRSRHFSRNGSRPRTLELLDMTLTLRLPRIVCRCGGSVCLDFGGLLRPYQRTWDDVDLQIKRWAGLCLSLRQMQRELRHWHIGPLGLRTLTLRVHQLQELTPTLDSHDVPPVLQVDAIWITQLRPNGKITRDAKGRQRVVKGRVKRPLLIALGTWPESQHTRILAWQLGEDESTATWLAFLSHLEEQGIRGENGLELIIHDGGAGLCSALQTVYFGAPQQRCLFHKLRNIANALQFPDDLSAQQRSKRRRALLKVFAWIWQAQRRSTAIRRYHRIVEQYRTSQPQAVATLRRDFRDTLTYYQLEQQHPAWPRTYLRTTSHLERFNRSLRAAVRSAGAYHSDAGILAMIAQRADAFSHKAS